MPIKKNIKNNLKFTRFLTKGLSAVLGATIVLGSGAACFAQPVGNATGTGSDNYFNDSDVTKQTRIMMDGNNFLKPGFYMQAYDINVAAGTATLKLTIPGYEMSNLKVYLMRKSPQFQYDLVECKMSGDKVYLENLKSYGASYDVHVYNGSLAKENFVCKAEFNVVNEDAFTFLYQVPIVYNSSAQAAGVNLVVSAMPDNRQVKIQLPKSMIPSNCTTTKVVFFKRGSSKVCVEHTLYDYAVRNGDGDLVFYPDANDTISVGDVYEAHFYRDEVRPGNFICKAEEITFSY